MKLSSVLKPLSTFAFWISMTWLIYTFMDPEYPLYLELIATAVVWSFSLWIRKADNGKAHIFLHCLILIAICFVQYGYILFSIPLFLFQILHVVLSIFARAKKMDFMDKLTGAEITFWAILFIISFVVGNADMFIAYLIFASLVMLRFVQNMAIRNEEHLRIISEYSVMNRDEMQINSNKMTLIFGGIMFFACIGFGLLGRLPAIQNLMSVVRDFIWKIIGIFRSSNEYRPPRVTEETVSIEFSSESERYVDDTPFSNIWTVIGVIGVVLAVCWALFCIIERIVKHKKIYMPDFGEETKITKIEKKQKIKKNKDKPEDYSYRKAIRRMYKNKIKKGRGKRNDDLISKTPLEHRKKKIEEGYQVSEGFVDMYERARYSNERVTREDVKRVQNEKK